MTETTSEHLDKRDALRAKIEASERRIAQRSIADDARDAAGAATRYAKENPLTVLAGAIALGLLVGAMTKPGRRAARSAATSAGQAVNNGAKDTAKSVGNAAKKRGAAVSNLFADAVVAYGIKLIDDALDGARAGQDKLEDIGDKATARAREARREAEYYAGSAADRTRDVSQRTRRKAKRAVRDLADRVSG